MSQCSDGRGVKATRRDSKRTVRYWCRQPEGRGAVRFGSPAGGTTSSASLRHQSKNAASAKLGGVICVSDWLSHPVLPRTPSLELSVLPNGGGQIPGLARSGPTVYNMDGAEGDRTPDLCIANAALSQLSYSPATAPVRDVSYPAARSGCQTTTAPRPSGAAVTDRNLAGHPTLSTRRATARKVTHAPKRVELTPFSSRSTPT